MLCVSMEIGYFFSLKDFFFLHLLVSNRLYLGCRICRFFSKISEKFRGIFLLSPALSAYLHPFPRYFPDIIKNISDFAQNMTDGSSFLNLSPKKSSKIPYRYTLIFLTGRFNLKRTRTPKFSKIFRKISRSFFLLLKISLF